MKYYLLPLIFLVFGCTQSQESSLNVYSDQEVPLQSQEPSLNVYSAEEVALHNSSSDCWMIIDNNIYDLTQYINSHPGGNTILQGCGKDATELFESRPMGSNTPHSSMARSLLRNYLKGAIE